jgi:hypothetical protein
MPKFRKKPIEIEAVEVGDVIRDANHVWGNLPSWVRGAYDAGKILFLRDRVEIITLEGNMTASRGDWLIRGVKGEIYPCKPDIFAATYEPVGSDNFDASNTLINGDQA